MKSTRAALISVARGEIVLRLVEILAACAAVALVFLIDRRQTALAVALKAPAAQGLTAAADSAWSQNLNTI